MVTVKKSQNTIQKLYWTSVHGRNESEAYHFVSAYLDDRKDANGRPAIVVVGYFSRTAKPAPLYCLFKYSSGRTSCLQHAATQTVANCDNIVDQKKSKPMLYLCHLTADTDEISIPVSVMISNISNCNITHTSGEISVGNLDHIQKGGPILQKKKFGVSLENH